MQTEQNARLRFAANLRSRREALGVSQEALADLCGLDRTAVSLLERSQRSPLLDTVVALARALELDSAGELLDGIR